MEGDQQEMKEICPNGELNPFSKTGASSQPEVQLVVFFFLSRPCTAGTYQYVKMSYGSHIKNHNQEFVSWLSRLRT